LTTAEFHNVIFSREKKLQCNSGTALDDELAEGQLQGRKGLLAVFA
jgi:hypothetical protein